jgi:hypothetical protein
MKWLLITFCAIVTAIMAVSVLALVYLFTHPF